MLRPPTPWSIARFIRFYGAGLYVNDQWPTRDGKIPAALYDVLLSQMDSVETAEQLRAANAGAHGQALVEAGDDFSVRSMTRQIHRRAFPTVRIPLTPAALRGTKQEEPLNFEPPPVPQ